MGFITKLLSGGDRPSAPVPVKPEKPISPVTNRATQEGIIRKKRQRASLATSTNRSLLNDETTPLGI